ncbi:putative membrane protein [Polaromonas sp. CG_9.11]|nr:putative membrane protein [Polaromonas sp. CG_9.11]
MQDIATSYPDAARITLVMDNLNTHTPASLYEAFAPEQAKALWDRFKSALMGFTWTMHKINYALVLMGWLP